MKHLSKDLYTKKDIIDQLSAMDAPQDSVVLMHSSLRLVGKVDGGGEALLDTLIEYFTARGGLFCVPTHTWAFMNEDITLDMTKPDTCLGAFSQIALRHTGGLRSENPTHSMVVFGEKERARAFIEGEIDLPSGTAPNSCYGKIFEQGGHILLVGVAHNRNTYLHCVDELLGIPNRLSEPRTVRIKRADGETVERRIRGHQNSYGIDISLRFPQFEPAFRYYGCITDGFIGNAPTQLCDAKGMKRVMEIIFERSGAEDPLKDERDIPPRLFARY